MMMNLDDAAVGHRMFEVSVLRQGTENAIESVSLHISAKPFEHRSSLAHGAKKITPRTACPPDPEHSLDEKPRIRAGAAKGHSLGPDRVEQ